MPLETLTFHSDSHELNLAFKLALETLAANVHSVPPTGLLDNGGEVIFAGQDYSSPWTRDASFNAWYAASLLIPEIAKNTLLSVAGRENGKYRILGDYWDAVIWIHAAWEHFLRTGDRPFLELAFQVAMDALDFFETTELDKDDGLFQGGACFMDGISAYPDKFVTPEGDSGIMGYARTRKVSCKALSTNCLYYMACQAASRMAEMLGRPCGTLTARATSLAKSIDARFFDAGRQRYRYLLDAADPNPEREEGLGHAFLLISGLAGSGRAQRILQYVHRTKQGLPCVWPTYKRYAKSPGGYGRHSGTVWPQVNAAWCIALARHGFVEEAWKEIQLQATRVVRDGQFRELYHPETGLPYAGLQEFPGEGICQHFICAHHQTWAATGFVAMVFSVLAGLNFQTDGLRVEPWLPPDLEGFNITGMPYRNAQINLTVSCTAAPGTPVTAFVPATTKGELTLKLRGKMSQRDH